METSFKTNYKRLLTHAFAGIVIPPLVILSSFLVAEQPIYFKYYMALGLTLLVTFIPLSLTLFISYLVSRPMLKLSKDKIVFKGLYKKFEIPFAEIQELEYFQFMNSEYLKFSPQRKAISLEYLDVKRLELSKIIHSLSDERLLPKFKEQELPTIEKFTLAFLRR